MRKSHLRSFVGSGKNCGREEIKDRGHRGTQELTPDSSEAES